ncbi:MAG: hypothetical protein FJ319_06000 [SAR202 cluster bacterium]|nr:hypothetical protein [SAR202 cluster bacterium]
MFQYKPLPDESKRDKPKDTFVEKVTKPFRPITDPIIKVYNKGSALPGIGWLIKILGKVFVVVLGAAVIIGAIAFMLVSSIFVGTFLSDISGGPE